MGDSDGVSLAYDSRLGFKYGPGVEYTQLVLRPELAESWDISPDATTFTFHIRKGVKLAGLPPSTAGS